MSPLIRHWLHAEMALPTTKLAKFYRRQKFNFKDIIKCCYEIFIKRNKSDSRFPTPCLLPLVSCNYAIILDLSTCLYFSYLFTSQGQWPCALSLEGKHYMKVKVNVTKKVKAPDIESTPFLVSFPT